MRSRRNDVCVHTGCLSANVPPVSGHEYTLYLVMRTLAAACVCVWCVRACVFMLVYGRTLRRLLGGPRGRPCVFGTKTSPAKAHTITSLKSHQPASCFLPFLGAPSPLPSHSLPPCLRMHHILTQIDRDREREGGREGGRERERQGGGVETVKTASRLCAVTMLSSTLESGM